MRIVGAFAFAMGIILAAWAWLGAPVAIPQPPIAGPPKLDCVSYAPFRDTQSPLEPATRIDSAQIDDDMARLSRTTECVRTYSTRNGLDRARNRYHADERSFRTSEARLRA